MSNLWQRLMGRRHDAEVRRADEEQHMSPAERRAAEEPVEGHASDEAAAEHLGGFDPADLEER